MTGRRRRQKSNFSLPARQLLSHFLEIDFEVTLASLFAYEGDSGSVWHYFAINVDSLWVCKGLLSNKIHFPYRFQRFYKMPGNDMSDRNANFAYDYVDSYAIWVYVGSTLGPVCDCQVGSNANSLRIGPKSAPSRLISKLNTFRRRIFVWHKSL